VTVSGLRDSVTAIIVIIISSFVGQTLQLIKRHNAQTAWQNAFMDHHFFSISGRVNSHKICLYNRREGMHLRDTKFSLIDFQVKI
jgi:hypothetical protein